MSFRVWLDKWTRPANLVCSVCHQRFRHCPHGWGDHQVAVIKANRRYEDERTEAIVRRVLKETR